MSILKIPILIMSHGQNEPVLRGLYRNWRKWEFDWYKVIVVSNQEYNYEDFAPWDCLLVPRSNWKEEWLLAIRKLKELGYVRFILYLDDFYLTSRPSLEGLLSACKIRTNYIRLTPYERPYYQRLFSRQQGCESIPRDHPYYSSLQIAIWNLDYFESQLLKASDIWDFERLPGANHMSVCKAVFSYRHSVEKGRWKWYALLLFRKEIDGVYYLKEREGFLSLAAVLDVARFLKFNLIGY